MTAREIREALEKTGYIATDDISYAVSGTVNERIPLLIEGSAGAGKTSLAEHTAQALGLELIRAQIYDSVNSESLLYDYDYQKQLLSIEAIRSSLDNSLKEKSPEQALEAVKDVNFYGEQFLIRRPVLRAITSEKPVVLLIDEIDKSSEELEYALLEVLDTYSMSIPELGRKIICREEARPLVFLTSNNYRDLSDALKRRCNYLYIRRKTGAEIAEIMQNRLQVDTGTAEAFARCLVQLQNLNLRQTPSISEGLTWASYILNHPGEDVANSAFLLAKSRDDVDPVTSVLKQYRSNGSSGENDHAENQSTRF